MNGLAILSMNTNHPITLEEIVDELAKKKKRKGRLAFFFITDTNT